MQLRFALVLNALFTLGVVAESKGKVVKLSVGVGCEFSSYSALPVATASKPSYRLQLDPGLGRGIYVLLFTQFSLPDDDLVIVRASDATKTLPPMKILSGKNTTGEFYSKGIAGTGVTIELLKAKSLENSTSCRGFTVSELLFAPMKNGVEAHNLQVAVKVSLGKVQNVTQSDSENDESICGFDESVEAACAPSYVDSNQGAYMLAKSHSVARLSITKDNGRQIAYCTGWLIGCEGHMITNEHCISNVQDAINTKVEFLAQSSSCGGGETCATRGGCPGRVEVVGTTLVAVSEELDYALVRLGVGNSFIDYRRLYEATGYLQFRGTGAVINENIYIPQHPQGYGKRIAWLFKGRPGRVESLTVTNCRMDDIGYYVDTQEGSSGAPIISTVDNNVIALHHCGGCLNGGIPAQSIVNDLLQKGVLPDCTVAMT
ncbi:uncharacterized protein CCR75_006226 [Bremia lactucae]|uniref:Serine protease n=1 Tax=Bremia lactucae TaxID=4779 RepID=A0A976NZ22_BRELC|nr:hypothetical protein CCR75_006226 [Bremia lactucae]